MPVDIRCRSAGLRRLRGGFICVLQVLESYREFWEPQRSESVLRARIEQFQERQIRMELSNLTMTDERRTKDRIYIPFPAAVEGVDVYGEEFNISTVLDNLSGNSLYLRMMPTVRLGSKISVMFRLSTAATAGTRSSFVHVRGTVVRTDEKPGGASGVAIKFKPPRRFIRA